MKGNRKQRLLALAFALMLTGVAVVPQQAHAGMWCGYAARFDGQSDVLNGMCLMEYWMDSTDASDGWF